MFTYDVTGDRGKVRLYCHDTTDGTLGTDYDFTDADIDAFLEQNSGDIWLAAADACRSLAAKAGPTAYLLRLPGALEIDKKKVASFYLSLAKQYEQRASTGVGGVVEYIDSFDIDVDALGRDNSEYVGDI